MSEIILIIMCLLLIAMGLRFIYVARRIYDELRKVNERRRLEVKTKSQEQQRLETLAEARKRLGIDKERGNKWR